ncbi:TRM11 family SAM-dependent methyltransferase [Paenibacillus prosopidis]|uniref:tRNA G10 N-methylase Trm11 n=1 Tax=Paenibacillus prosopidis TaxID=630520 RepID=A0A368VRN6_9BACL|nr:methyltransferase domain-containing protein [Paenibacillus prosopidis]RCW44327.1 tRNA G10 N-methylase Trm11 [Paenibacillus prosopidis]
MFIYTYASHEDEASLCELELRTLFGQKVGGGIIISSCGLSVDRSPFIKRRIKVMLEANSLEELALKLTSIELDEKTFKVLFTSGDEPFSYEERRLLERTAGAAIKGKADMRKPERLFGLTKLNGIWHFGLCEENGAIWLKHQNKPQNYSTALPTRAARAIVNIAAGQEDQGIRMIDPCCGMGTVLIEAMSMGMDIEGVDLNPLAVRGARVNLAHFGYPDRVKLGDMRQLETNYDAAIVDMPYNLCSVLPEDEQLAMLESVRRLAKRAVIVTTEPIGRQLELAAWRIIDFTTLSKASFTRYITVVE